MRSASASTGTTGTGTTGGGGGRQAQPEGAVGRRHALRRHLLAHQRRQVAGRAVQLELVRPRRRRVEEQREQPRQPFGALPRLLQVVVHARDAGGEGGGGSSRSAAAS